MEENWDFLCKMTADKMTVIIEAQYEAKTSYLPTSHSSYDHDFRILVYKDVQLLS